MPVLCDHAETFDCHGTKRCSVCYVDSLVLPDGTLRWPSQERPETFTGEAIAEWFLEHRRHAQHGADGFTFCRNNLNPGGALYGYVWEELYLDLDFYAAWMLDVRRHDELDETRQYLFVAIEHVDVARVVWHDFAVKFRDERINRLIEGLRWFATQTDLWLATSKRG